MDDFISFQPKSANGPDPSKIMFASVFSRKPCVLESVSVQQSSNNQQTSCLSPSFHKYNRKWVPWYPKATEVKHLVPVHQVYIQSHTQEDSHHPPICLCLRAGLETDKTNADLGQTFHTGPFPPNSRSIETSENLMRLFTHTIVSAIVLLIDHKSPSIRWKQIVFVISLLIDTSRWTSHSDI